MQKIPSYDDKELFRLIAAGDSEAFTKIFHHYRIPLFEYAIKITKLQTEAEELVQETFLKLWAYRSKLKDVDNPGSYIFRIARNASVDFLRKLASTSALHNKVWAGMSGSDDTTLETVELNETRRILDEAVKQLSVHKQRVFYLSRYKGMSYEEISRELGIARGTVKNQLAKALKFLREYLEQRYGAVVAFIILFYVAHPSPGSVI